MDTFMLWQKLKRTMRFSHASSHNTNHYTSNTLCAKSKMRSYHLGPIAASLLLLNHALGFIRRDLTQKNINVAQMEGEYTIDLNTQEVLFIDRVSDFEEAFRCSRQSGKQLTWNEDGSFIACCAPGYALIGSQDSAFDCCTINQYVTGSDATGYKCCPLGQIYDGSKCRYPDPDCTDGKILVDGACACPINLIEYTDGSCREPPPPACDSGVREGIVP